MEDFVLYCIHCGTELLGDEEEDSGICAECYDEDQAELGFLDELIDFGGMG